MKSISYYVKHLVSKRWVKVTLVAALLITPALVLSGCGKQSANTVSVGLVGSDDEKTWKPIARRLKKKGIHLKIVDFSDYNQPNAATKNQEIDINAFQTPPFLKLWNHAHHAHLVSDGKTALGPIALYSQKIHKLSQLKAHSTITLPNDTSNEARALNLLQSSGLIKLKRGVSEPSVSDVVSNKKHLKLEPITAAQTPRTLKDVTASVINSNFALDAHLNPKKALYTEPLNKKIKPYINIIASSKSEKKRKAVKEVVKAYQSKATAKSLEKNFHGNEIPAWNLKLK